MCIRDSFYSHASCEARRQVSFRIRQGFRFLLTRLLRGATPAAVLMSIMSLNFYSHASCEARPKSYKTNQPVRIFLLTRLLRGATPRLVKYLLYIYISTHTPLARRDWFGDMWEVPNPDFYSHASCEARRSAGVNTVCNGFISTHTPLARRDMTKNFIN